MTAIDGNILDGVSETTLWTLHNRGSEAKRSDGVIRDPWAVTLVDSIDYDYLKFGTPNQSMALRAAAFDIATREYLTAHLEPDDVLGLIRDCAARFPGGHMMFDSIPHWLSRKTLKGLKLSNRYTTPPMPFGLTADEALDLAATVPGVRSARDIPLPRGRGLWRLMGWPPLDCIGFHRRLRPSITVLEFE